jgi:hypothetical protein
MTELARELEMTSAATTALRRFAFGTAVITALAIAAPVAGASAATDPPAAVVGPTLIGDVFNGNTTIITSPGPALGTTIDSH